MSRASDGRGSVFRSTDGPGWEGYVSVGIDPLSGKRVRRHVRGRTKSEVQQKVDLLITQGRRGSVLIDARITLSEWLDMWVEERRTVVRPSTLSGYRTDLTYLHRSGIGGIALGRLVERDLDRLYDWVIGRGCNRGTLQHLRRTLNPALDTAVSRGYLNHNPLSQVALRGERGHVNTPYDFDEISKLLLAARARHNGARWDIAFIGLRQGEVLGLRWPDIDLDRAELTVRHSLRWRPWQHGCAAHSAVHSAANANATEGSLGGHEACRRPARWCPQRHGGGPEFAQAKTAAGDRSLALPAPLVARLREHRERQDVERAAAGALWTEHGCVFAGPSGSPIDRTTDREDWLEIVAAANVRQLRIHDLRHTAATALLLLGEDSRTIMAVMGWSAPSLVTRYAHVVPDLRRRVAVKQSVLFDAHSTSLNDGPAQAEVEPARQMAADAGQLVVEHRTVARKKRR